MWLFVMFDLPTETKIDKKNYQVFRKYLLNGGFQMYQYSIYIRYCDTDEQINKHTNRINTNLPPDGNVSILKITDKQYQKIVKLNNINKSIDIQTQQIVLL